MKYIALLEPVKTSSHDQVKLQAIILLDHVCNNLPEMNSEFQNPNLLVIVKTQTIHQRKSLVWANVGHSTVDYRYRMHFYARTVLSMYCVKKS